MATPVRRALQVKMAQMAKMAWLAWSDRHSYLLVTANVSMVVQPLSLVLISDADGSLSDAEVTDTSYLCAPTQLNQNKHFNRVAVFPVCTQIDANCNDDTETAAEIVAASTDGTVLIYTDSPTEQLGFIDINDPTSPAPMGTLALPGEPHICGS